MNMRSFANKTSEGDAAFEFLVSFRAARPSQCGTFDLHDIVGLLREQLLGYMEELERRGQAVDYQYMHRGEVVKTSLIYQLDALRLSEPAKLKK